MRWFVAPGALALGGCSLFLSESPSNSECEPEPPPGVAVAAAFEVECFDDELRNDDIINWVEERELLDISGALALRAISNDPASGRDCTMESLDTCGSSLSYQLDLAPGAYLVHIRADAPNDNANSVWLEVDGGPRDAMFMESDGPGLDWFEDGSAIDVTSTLTTLTISIRELDVAIDAVALEPL